MEDFQSPAAQPIISSCLKGVLLVLLAIGQKDVMLGEGWSEVQTTCELYLRACLEAPAAQQVMMEQDGVKILESIARCWGRRKVRFLVCHVNFSFL